MALCPSPPVLKSNAFGTGAFGIQPFDNNRTMQNANLGDVFPRLKALLLHGRPHNSHQFQCAVFELYTPHRAHIPGIENDFRMIYYASSCGACHLLHPRCPLRPETEVESRRVDQMLSKVQQCLALQLAYIRPVAQV